MSTEALPAVVGKGLSMGRDRALDGSVVAISLRGHAFGVDVPPGERETAHSIGVDGVLVVLATGIIVSVFNLLKTHLIDLLDLCPSHDHHVAMFHGDFQHLLVGNVPPVLDGGQQERRLALGAELHDGRRAQREGSDDRAEFVLAIIVILRLFHVSNRQ